ncbi:MAG TPA: mechanosensitive ion channel family protein [Kiritimatiellia bacterium]|nr:mechanosensitive ion channel family protein [Kiritimatiellia bacterium]HMP35270.1 mechanosensitive ion channel family protein [Kiritimatiellia bacterium]
MEAWYQQIGLAGNEWWRIIALFGVVVTAVVAAKFGKMFLLRSADVFERLGRPLVATAIRSLSKSIVLIAIAIAFPLGAAFLSLGDLASSMVFILKSILISLAIGSTLYHLIDVVTAWLAGHAEPGNNTMQGMLTPIIRTSLQVTVIALTVLQVVQSLTDRPLTSILAGLGVGGLAVALAAQDTIKHFFGSLVVFADKPFQVGERITVDNTDGTVELVGFRSTRIRTLEGALVSIPNGDLANKTIINVGRRPHIRHRAIISITYGTPPEKVEQALSILRELLRGHEGLHPNFPPRVAFDEFATSSLNLLVMFWYHPADFWKYKQYAESFNLQVLRSFNEAGISFAFPTQTVHLVRADQKDVAP